MDIEYEGPPSEWISRHGVPAGAVGGWQDGMPSFEHEDNGFVIMELLIAASTANGSMMLVSPWYGTAVVLAPDGMVPLHHNPGALWEWRPLLYPRQRWGWSGMGSQNELGWRYGLADMQQANALVAEYVEEERAYREFTPSENLLYAMAKEALEMPGADDRAETLLAEHLAPQQLLEWRSHFGGFLVRGGETGKTYRVSVGDGFTEVDPVTLQILRSYCLHPEEWIPHADVALATKLGLENPETEEATVEGGRGTDREATRIVFAEERVAAALERELIPA